MTTGESATWEKRAPEEDGLSGGVVAITGAARGLGRALTRAFLARGASVVAMDRSWDPSGFSGDRDQSFRQELRDQRDRVFEADVDIRDDTQVGAAYQSAVERFGTIDVLIDNAAMRQRDLFPPTGRVTTLETTDADWRAMFDVNVFGAINVIRHFVQPMIAQQRGSIMTVVSSGALHHSSGGAYHALRPYSKEMPYQATKAALMTATFYLADELAGSNVAVNALISGHARTTGFDEQNAARRVTGVANAEGRPAALTADHIVPPALYLATKDANSGITGKAFDVPTWLVEHGWGTQREWADIDAEVGIDAALNAM